MPLLLVIALAVSAAACAAGLTWIFASRPWKSGGAWRTSAGWLLALPLGVYLGCAILGEWPQWPPMNDRQRVLAQLLPLVVVVETIVVLVAKPVLAMLLRGTVAASVAPLLLYKSIYLADLAGPGSAKWTSGEATLILLGIAVLIAVDWLALANLQQRTSDRTVAALLVLTSFSAGMAVVMSGYMRGGLMGLPWACSLLGAAVATRWAPTDQRHGSLVGIGLLGVAYVLVVGHFFGALDAAVGVIIAASPLLAWIAELPAMKSWPDGRRAVVRWALVALPLVVVLTLLSVKFVRAISEDPLL